MMLSTEIYVYDVAKSAEFFEHFFGFKVAYQQNDFATLWLGKTRLILNILELDQFTPPNPILKDKAKDYLGAGVELVISIDNLDDTYTRLQKEEVGVTEIKKQEWGLRDFRFITKEGYYIRVTEPDKSVEAITDET